MKRIGDLHAVLFPHSYLQESDIKKILSIFDTLTLCQPWFMDRPVSISGAGESDFIRILNPPVTLKPGEGFKTLAENDKVEFTTEEGPKGLRAVNVVKL